MDDNDDVVVFVYAKKKIIIALLFSLEFPPLKINMHSLEYLHNNTNDMMSSIYLLNIIRSFFLSASNNSLFLNIFNNK